MKKIFAFSAMLIIAISSLILWSREPVSRLDIGNQTSNRQQITRSRSLKRKNPQPASDARRPIRVRTSSSS